MTQRSEAGAARDVLILTRAEIADLMGPADYLEAVETGFRAGALGAAAAPAPLHIAAPEGGFHVKAAALDAPHGAVAVKINANYPGNPAARGLPTIQGVIVLFDAASGSPLAIMDSIEITSQRTAAATALAARHLARPDSATATICGCGEQGRAQLAALRHVLSLRRVFAWDRNAEAATAFAAAMSGCLSIAVAAAPDLRAATIASDVVVTCTTARAPFLGLDDVRPGTFIAAVGADNPEKSELAPTLMARGKVVADLLRQCVTMGDLHHAIAASAMTEADVHAELGELVIGTKPGRVSQDEITIFDSTGTALQDVAAAAGVYARARARGIGTTSRLGEPR